MSLSKVQIRKMLARGEKLPEQYEKEKELPWNPLYFPEKVGLDKVIPEKKEKIKPPRNKSIRSFGNLRDYQYCHLEKSDKLPKEKPLSLMAQKKKERREKYKAQLQEKKMSNLNKEDELDTKHTEEDEFDDEYEVEVELDEFEKLKQDLDKSSSDLMEIINKEMEDIKNNDYDMHLRPNNLLLHMPHAVK